MESSIRKTIKAHAREKRNKRQRRAAKGFPYTAFLHLIVFTSRAAISARPLARAPMGVAAILVGLASIQVAKRISRILASPGAARSLTRVRRFR